MMEGAVETRRYFCLGIPNASEAPSLLRAQPAELCPSLQCSLPVRSGWGDNKAQPAGLGWCFIASEMALTPRCDRWLPDPLPRPPGWVRS